MGSFENTMGELARRGFDHEFGKPRIEGKSVEAWEGLVGVGTELWLDTGDLEEATRLWSSQFTALTTNNSLLNKEVQKGIYDDLVKESAETVRAAKADAEEQALLVEMAFLLNAYHGLRLVEQFDAFVSVELHTDLCDDLERTVAYGKRFHDICPERFFVKVPFTPAGILGARKLGEMGVPINLTLGFSARQNYVVASLARPSYVNVFMGRLNAFVSDHGLGDGVNVGEKATLATQRVLLELKGAGKTRSKLIGASMRSGEQVAALAGLDVYTMPPKVAEQYMETPSDSLSSQVQVDPDVVFTDGMADTDFGGDKLWDVSDDLKDVVEGLVDEDLSRWTPEDLQECFHEGDVGDLFPRWTDEDRETIVADGKIPVYETWKERILSKDVSVDALLNISGLYAFTKDQTALDDRVKSLL